LKPDPSHLLTALTAETIRANGLPTIVVREALVEGNGQPAKEFPEPFIKGNFSNAKSLYLTSVRSKVRTVNIITVKEISILHLQLVTRGQDGYQRVDS
jgi:hypothetical protein